MPRRPRSQFLLLFLQNKMICIMVGLPARGKTYVSQKLSRYLSWLGYTTKTFNVGNYRRAKFGSELKHDFFSTANPEATEMRKQAAEDALTDLLKWLSDDTLPSTTASPPTANSDTSPQSSSDSLSSNPLTLPTMSNSSKKSLSSHSATTNDTEQTYLGHQTDFSYNNCDSDKSFYYFNDTFPCTILGFNPIIQNSIENNSKVGIYDATNSTKERRAWILKRILQAGFLIHQVVFIEIICNDESIIHSNILQVKLSSPDYINYKSSNSEEEVVNDFTQRIQHYKEAYESLDNEEWDHVLEQLYPCNKRTLDVPESSFESFKKKSVAIIKIIDVGTKLIFINCKKYWQTRIGYYLMNLHISPRVIYLCRHGESELNLLGKIGGNSSLSLRGWNFAKTLPAWIDANVQIENKEQQLIIWTSTLKRTIQTAYYLKYPKFAWKALDEINAGNCEGLSYEEIEDRFPIDFRARDIDKFHFRYPDGGESYEDLVLRLEPVMMELERQQNIFLIGHQAVLRTIYAYYVGLGREELAYVNIPLHTIIELRSRAYGCDVISHQIPIPAVDTYRERFDLP